MPLLQLDAVQTLAFARPDPVSRLWGAPCCPRARSLQPAAADHRRSCSSRSAVLVARGQGVTLLQFDTTLQSPLMIAFFTSIGLGASLSLLRVGGPQVMLLLVIATVFAARAERRRRRVASCCSDLPPLFGVLAGSVTLTGGPATGLAFAPSVRASRNQRRRLDRRRDGDGGHRVLADSSVDRWARSSSSVIGLKSDRDSPSIRSGDELRCGGPLNWTSGERRRYGALKSIVVILVAMWAGAWVSRGCAALGLTLPATIGAMLAGGVIRNLDDATGWIGIVATDRRERGRRGAVAVSRHGADDARAVESGRARAAARLDPRAAGPAGRRRCAAGRYFR